MTPLAQSTPTWSATWNRRGEIGAPGPQLLRGRARDSEEGPYSGPCPHGPVIANVTPGVWMLTNSHRPSGL